MNSETLNLSKGNSEKNDLNQTIVARLQELNEDDWIIYLQKLFYNLNPEPSLRFISRELFEQLFWIYNTLNETDKKARMLFTKSILHILRSISPQSSESSLIYELIYFVRETRPIEHRRLLEMIIKDESFKDLYFGSDNLHLLLVKSYSYIEDSQKLYLEEYVRNLLNPNYPYSLYVTIYYYGFLGHENKALDFLSKFFLQSKWTANEDLCKELYHTLTDCIPRYINLFNFLQRFIDDNVRIDYSNIHLDKYIKEFIIDLKANTKNSGLAFLAEDILKNEFDKIYEANEMGELFENEDLNNFIIEYAARKYESNHDLDVTQEDDKIPIEPEQLARETIDESKFFIAGANIY